MSLGISQTGTEDAAPVSKRGLCVPIKAHIPRLPVVCFCCSAVCVSAANEPQRKTAQITEPCRHITLYGSTTRLLFHFLCSVLALQAEDDCSVPQSHRGGSAACSNDMCLLHTHSYSPYRGGAGHTLLRQGAHITAFIMSELQALR